MISDYGSGCQSLLSTSMNGFRKHWRIGRLCRFFISGRERMESPSNYRSYFGNRCWGAGTGIGQILFPYVRKGAGFKLGKSKLRKENLPDDQLVAGQIRDWKVFRIDTIINIKKIWHFRIWSRMVTMDWQAVGVWSKM